MNDNDLLKKLININTKNGNTINEQLIARQKINQIINKSKSNINNKLNNNELNLDLYNKVINKQKEQQFNKYKQNTKKYTICPICGNDLFYNGPSGGLSTNILCDNCFHEFTSVGGFILHEINTNLDLDRLSIAYGISLSRLKKEKPKMYKKIYKKSSLLQKIHYMFR